MPRRAELRKQITDLEKRAADCRQMLSLSLTATNPAAVDTWSSLLAVYLKQIRGKRELLAHLESMAPDEAS